MRNKYINLTKRMLMIIVFLGYSFYLLAYSFKEGYNRGYDVAIIKAEEWIGSNCQQKEEIDPDAHTVKGEYK